VEEAVLMAHNMRISWLLHGRHGASARQGLGFNSIRIVGA
jgi:hypothetical protein